MYLYIKASAILFGYYQVNGASVHSNAEMYPETATSTEDRFVNFILNELARELNQEMVYYENLHHSGWQADRIIYHDQLASQNYGY